MVTRRQFLSAGALAGGALLLPNRLTSRRAWADSLPGGTLPPDRIRKFVQPLLIPPAMPKVGTAAGVDRYEISLRQFKQQILPPGFPKTTVWGYGSPYDASTFNAPSFTIEATCGRPVQVTWLNQLVDATGRYLPHLLPVDQTLHWANPAGGIGGRDTRPTFPNAQLAAQPYRGPVPMVPHLHGGHSGQESDGYPEAWFLPNAWNIPGSYATTGSWYDRFRAEAEQLQGRRWQPGSATFEYRNDQRATTLWYHDHSLGMTRLNVYAGPSGFYNIRGGADDLPAGVLPGPAPMPGDPPNKPYYEIPLVIQDRSFNDDGSLFYPGTRGFFPDSLGYSGPFIPDADLSPIWNPEFFANTITVNGRTWPYLQVEKRRYRFRLLNGCDSRFLMLRMSNGLPFWQIGADGGFLKEPARLDTLLVALAERADVIVDFTDVPPGTRIVMQNIGPDEPYNGEPFDPADEATTGQVMEFRVVAARSEDRTTPPQYLELPAVPDVGAPANVRQISLNESESSVPDTGPRAAMLGTVMFHPDMVMGMPMMWMDPVTEHPALDSTETWEIYNFTEDAHPIHVHQVQFAVVNREVFDPDFGVAGAMTAPQPWETGLKDTVVAYPGAITRINAHFDMRGRYVWHCHILSHEDNEMMRPYDVG